MLESAPRRGLVDPQWDRLLQQLAASWDWQQRVALLGVRHRDNVQSENYDVTFLASRATLFVTLQRQSLTQGGIDYNPASWVSKVRHDMRDNRLKTVTMNTVRDRPYYIFLIPTFLERDDTYTLFDGDDAADHMASFHLQARIPNVVTVTGDTTLVNQNHVVLADASGGAIVITLPALAADMSGQPYEIKKIDSSANAVTVDGNGSETIDGSTTQVLSAQYDAVRIRSDGTEWWIM